MQDRQAQGRDRRSATGWKPAAYALVALPLLQRLAEAFVTLPIGPSRMLSIALFAICLIPLALAALEHLMAARLSRSARAAVVVIVPLWFVAHLLVIARFADGPFGPVSGGPFQSATTPRPPDWEAIAPSRYLALEIDPRAPRTLETVFVVHDGGLFVAANMPELKRWPHVVRADPSIRVRTERGAVHALEAQPVDSVRERGELLAAMNEKYGFDLSLGTPIWFFALKDRADAAR